MREFSPADRFRKSLSVQPTSLRRFKVNSSGMKSFAQYFVESPVCLLPAPCYGHMGGRPNTAFGETPSCLLLFPRRNNASRAVPSALDFLNPSRGPPSCLDGLGHVMRRLHVNRIFGACPRVFAPLKKTLQNLPFTSGISPISKPASRRPGRGVFDGRQWRSGALRPGCAGPGGRRGT